MASIGVFCRPGVLTRRLVRPARRRFLRPRRLTAWDPRRDDVEAFYDRMDRWLDSVVREQGREADALFAEATRMRQQRGSYFWLERSEYSSSDGGSYYYSESVTTMGDPPWRLHSATASPSLGANILTVMAFVAAAVYAILTFRFNQNYAKSTFREDQRGKLSLMWPALMVSPEFRQKFGNVISPKPDEKPRQSDEKRQL